MGSSCARFKPIHLFPKEGIMDFTTISVIALVVITVVLLGSNQRKSRDLNTLTQGYESRLDAVKFAEAFDNAIDGEEPGSYEVNLFTNPARVKDTVEFIYRLNAVNKLFAEVSEDSEYREVTGEVATIKKLAQEASALVETSQRYLRVDFSVVLGQIDLIEHNGDIAESRKIAEEVGQKLERLLEPFGQLAAYMEARGVSRAEAEIAEGSALAVMLDLVKKIQAA